MVKDFSAFKNIESDIHFMLMLLENMLKLNKSDDEANNKMLAGLRHKYKTTMLTIAQKLELLPHPEEITEFCRTLSQSNLTGIDPKVAIRLTKKLEIDFEVILKKIEQHRKQLSEKPAERTKPSVAAKNSQPESEPIIPPNEKYTKQKILSIVKNNRKGFLSDFEKRQNAKKSLERLVQTIREHNPQKISDDIDNYVKTHPIKLVKSPLTASASLAPDNKRSKTTE